MIDNIIFKHKFMLFLFVLVSSFLIYDFAVKAEVNNSDFYNWEIVQYSFTDVTYPYQEAHFNFQSLEKLALILQGDSSYILVSASSNYTINFNDKCPVLIKFHDGNQQYNHEKNVTYYSKNVLSIDSLNDVSSVLPTFESNWKPIETNIPIFGTLSQAQNYFETGDTSGQINKPLEYIFDESIEMPVVHFPNFTKDNIDYTCFITNSTDKYYIEVQGRCHTFDDIELYKDKIYFKTREYSKLKNDLTTWISYKDSIQSKGEHDIADYAKNSFDNLLSLYPVDSRNIFGGTNAVGDFFSGYSAVLNQVKNDLATLRSHFNIIEFYIRFYYIDNNVVHYGKWCHVYNFVTDKDNLIYQSDIGMNDDEKNSLENSSDSLNDNNASNNLSQSVINSLNDDSLWNVIKNLVAGLGDFPDLVRSVFSFMPDWLFNILAFGITFIVILRFLGR